jgi:hypothetical protein
MPTTTYTITATFEDHSVAEEYIEWIKSEHVAAVLSAGATDVEVVRQDDPAWVVEARYHFASRDALSQFELGDAARLQQAEVRRFAPARGAQFTRATGTVAHAQCWGGAPVPLHARRAGIVQSAIQGL